MEWKEITLDNEWYVQWLFDRDIPFMIAFLEDGVTPVYRELMSCDAIHRIAKRGGYYFFELPPLEIKKV